MKKDSEMVEIWLTNIDNAGRVLIDPVAALDALDEMAQRKTLPTVGWMQRNTRRKDA